MNAEFSYTHLIVRSHGAVIYATLDRPEHSNALNRVLINELRDFFVRLYWRNETRVVVLAGNGRNFCAGGDIKEFSVSLDPTIEGALTAQRQISEIVIAMRRCPQPIIALVNGAASGAGLALALASDIRIATPTTRMNAAFIKIGLSACDIGVSYFLPRMVGSSVASELMLTGRFLGAERALGLGFV